MAQIPGRKPLLEWMDHGDPELVPVLLADPLSTAASYFGVAAREEGMSASFTDLPVSSITPEMILQCSRELGAYCHCNMGGPTHAELIDLTDDVEITVSDHVESDGEVRRCTTIRTPVGDLSDVLVTPPGMPAYYAEHLVRSDADLPAFTYMLESVATAVRRDSRARTRVAAKLEAEARKWPEDTVLYAAIGVPCFVLSSNLYSDPEAALYLIADHPEAMERLYEAYDAASDVWLQAAADAGADFIIHAINGLEIFSPDIFRRYLTPQARSLHERARKLGIRGWVHTCGHMNTLIETGAYSQMQLSVLESFSCPPLGDVQDLRRARGLLGREMVTRGAVNVDLFYDPDTSLVRQRAREVMEQCRGFRHMIGDTNSSFPPYPKDNILALVDEVAKSGRMLRYP